MGLATTFEVLAAARTPSVMPALLVALKDQGESLRGHAATTLLQLDDRDATKAVLEAFRTLPKHAQGAVSGKLGLLRQDLGRLLRSDRADQRELALNILSGSTSVDVLLLLADFLDHADGDERPRTLAHIEVVAQRFAREHGEAVVAAGGTTLLPPPRREQLEIALTAVTRGLRSGQETALFAPIALSIGTDAYPALFDVLLGKAGRRLREKLVREISVLDTREAHEFVLAMLGHESAQVRRQSHVLLAARAGKADRELYVAVLRTLTDERWASLVIANKGFPWLLPIEGRYTGLRPESFTVSAVALDHAEALPEEKARWWRILADCPVDAVSARAIERLMATRGAETETAMLWLLNNSVREDVQLAAIRWLGAARLPRAVRAVASKVQAEHEAVRQLATRVLVRSGFESFLSQFEKLDEQTRVQAGRAAVEADPDVAIMLVPELAHGDAARRLRALDIITACAAEHRLDRHLAALASDANLGVRIAVIPLLVRAATDAAKAALETLRQDIDGDVRRLAAEALGHAPGREGGKP